MKIRFVYILLLLGTLATGCKPKKMTAVDEPAPPTRQIVEPVAEEVAVDVDHTPSIMSIQERFTFTSDEDKTIHDQKEFFVIIGSFRRQDNAERFVQSLVAKGFTPVILLSETGLHRVSVDSFNSETDARSRIMKIRNQFTEHTDTWLLIRNR